MLYFTAELFIDALILLLFRPTAEVKALILKIVDIYETETENNTINADETIKFYISFIKDILENELNVYDRGNIEARLLKFKNHPTITKDPEIYTILKNVMIETIDISEGQYSTLLRKLNNALLWYYNSKNVKKLFYKLSSGGGITSPDKQDEIIKEVNQICTEIIDTNNGNAVQKQLEDDRVSLVNFDDKDVLIKAFNVHRKITVTNKFITGLQGLNLALDGGYCAGDSITFNSISHMGKALKNCTPVKIPGGWKNIEDLQVGDLVISRDGTAVPVTGVFPQGIKQMYRVNFIDGRWVDVSGDHLWTIVRYHNYGLTDGTRIRKYSKTVMTTLEIINRLQCDFGKRNTRIELCEPTQDPDVDLPIHPYLLGVLIGDGSLSHGTPVITTDKWIKDKIIPMLPENMYVNPRELKTFNCDYAGEWLLSTRKTDKEYTNPLINQLRQLGLYGKRAWEKFVPEMYLNASTSQRIQLLQGLFDTDGYIAAPAASPHREEAKSSLDYSTTSYQLALDVQYLIRSIGGLCKIRAKQPHYTKPDGSKVECRTAYIVNPILNDYNCLFTLPRKAERLRPITRQNRMLALTSIEPLLEKDYCTCITVDHPEQLFVTKDFIVTHNSMILNKLTRWQFQYNRPPRDIKNPLIMMISLENETYQNIEYMFRELWINIRRELPPTEITIEQKAEFIYEVVRRSGWKLVFDRKLGENFAYSDFVAMFTEYQKAGYTPVLAVIDYMNMMAKSTAASDKVGNHLLVRELYTKICNFTKSHGCTIATAAQLNRKAMEVAQMFPHGAVKKFGPSMLADSTDVQREVDIVFYMHIEKDTGGRSFWTFNWNKHRYNDGTPESAKYFAYMFRGPYGIPDDVRGKSQAVKNISAVPFNEEMSLEDIDVNSNIISDDRKIEFHKEEKKEEVQDIIPEQSPPPEPEPQPEERKTITLLGL